jgi:hypothetical protein
MSQPEPQSGRVPALLVTGTIGAGKTVLTEQISEILHARDLPHALMGLDELGQLYPPPENDPFNMSLALENLRTTWPNFRRRGARYLIMGATIETRDQLEQFRRAVPDTDVTVCRVTASSATVAARIRRRELGSLLEPFLARTDDLAARIAAADLDDFTVDNDDRPIIDVANDVLARLGWLAQ